MQPLIIIFISLLLFTGILGGGLSIREFKLPKATLGVRFTAILTALILLISGFVFHQPKKISFSLTNVLMKDVLKERVVVTIEGKELGTITSDISKPSSTTEFTVSKAGMYNYSVEMFSLYEDNGKEVSFYSKGSGTIDIESGDSFEVQEELNNKQITIKLVEK